MTTTLQTAKKQIVKGFTIIELTVVLVLMLIVFTYVGINWPNQSVDLRVQADHLTAGIRFTQILSNERNQLYRIDFINSTSWRIADGNNNTYVYVGDGTNRLYNGATMTFPTSPLIFGSDGTPYSGTSTPPAPLTTNFVIVLTSSDNLTTTITVEPLTGNVTNQ